MAEGGPRVVIIGAGGHARTVAEAAEEVVGHLTPVGEAEPAALLGPRLGDDGEIEVLSRSGHTFAIGVGFVDRDGAAHRARLLDDLAGAALATVRHPASIVSPSAVLSAGVFVAAGAVVGPGVVLERAAIVNTGAVIDHDCRIGENVHIGPGAVLSGGVEVGEHSLVGVGATVRQGVRIGSSVVVGAGAAVVNDLPDECTAIGVPARAIAP